MGTLSVVIGIGFVRARRLPNGNDRIFSFILPGGFCLEARPTKKKGSHWFAILGCLLDEHTDTHCERISASVCIVHVHTHTHAKLVIFAFVGWARAQERSRKFGCYLPIYTLYS